MLTTAIDAARQAGALLRRNFGKPLKVHQTLAHDIKLELDLRAQQVIERVILKRFPRHAILGEESATGTPDSDYRWVIDPLDGTVNYTYSIPHFCVSIACQKRDTKPAGRDAKCDPTPGWTTVAGVVYDPMREEMFSASAGKAARLNGRLIRASSRRALADAVVSVGFFKTSALINQSMPHFRRLVHRARKIRIMGAAALDLAYVACGRYDAYIEYGIKLWDIAAGLLILEKSRGTCELKRAGGEHTYNIFASGKLIRSEVVKRF